MSSAPKIKFTLKTNRPGDETSSPSANPVPESLTPEQKSARQREQLEGKLLGAIDCLWQMELKAGDVTEKNVDFLVTDMDNLVKHYAGISALSSEMKETVQYAALQQVDQESLNPHRWTRDLLSTALRANQLGNARVKAYESYHDTLVDAMREAFPDMQDVLIPLKDTKDTELEPKVNDPERGEPTPS